MPVSGGDFQTTLATKGSTLNAWLDGDRMVYLASEIFAPEGTFIAHIVERNTTVPKAGGTALRVEAPRKTGPWLRSERSKQSQSILRIHDFNFALVGDNFKVWVLRDKKGL